MAMATSKLLYLAILCFLLALQHYHFVLEAARVLNENQTPHGDDENRKGAVKGHPQKPDGSHVSHAPTSKSAVESRQSVGGSGCHIGRQIFLNRLDDRIPPPSPGSVCAVQYPRTVPSPKSPDEDPLEAYHFNCTVCD